MRSVGSLGADKHLLCLTLIYIEMDDSGETRGEKLTQEMAVFAPLSFECVIIPTDFYQFLLTRREREKRVF